MTDDRSRARQPAPRIRDVAELRRIAHRLRKQVVRLVAPTLQGYVQQGLGAADLFATMYFAELRLDPADAHWPERDRFILSTAHNTAVLYASMAARGLIPEAMLATYCKDGSPLEINASERLGPLVEASCGSLGQGLSVATGMAMAGKRQGRSFRVYVILGDGEMQEGQVWEAAMAAAHHRLGNLCVIVDDNRMQAAGHVERIMTMEPVVEKWRSFGWHAELVDGHDIPALLDALDAARMRDDRPSCLVARTLVGKGAPSLEGVFGHNMRLPPDMAAKALAELDAGDPA
jgi:transketolase